MMEEALHGQLGSPDTAGAAAATWSAEVAGGANADRATAEGPAREPARPKVVARGYLLKRSRRGPSNEKKPWKKRYFVLHGSTLLYYRHENMAGAHKVLVTLEAAGCEIDLLADSPWNAKASFPFAIRQGGVEIGLAVTEDAEARDYWITMLSKARGLPAPELADQSSRYAGSSTVLRLRMGVSAALASSTAGRAILKLYLDADSRALIAGLLEFARAERSAKQVRAMEKAAFDIMARIGVIVHAAKMPPDLDLSLLYDETINFSHDFLTHCRDQRLKAVRGSEAEVLPIDPDELLRALGVVTESWKSILIPHSSPKVLASFDTICAAFCRADRLSALLLEPAHTATRNTIETSLRGVMERY